MSQTVTFHMRGGHTIVTTGVKEITMRRDNASGAYAGYEITWEEGRKPLLFSLSIPDIVAVTAVENKGLGWMWPFGV